MDPGAGGRSEERSPGPSSHLVCALTAPPTAPQLLFQESNPGVRYEYTIHREATDHGQVQPPEFSWQYRPWSKCTVTCGTGERRNRPTWLLLAAWAWHLSRDCHFGFDVHLLDHRGVGTLISWSHSLPLLSLRLSPVHPSVLCPFVTPLVSHGLFPPLHLSVPHLLIFGPQDQKSEPKRP